MAMARNRKLRKPAHGKYIVAVRVYHVLESGRSITIIDKTGKQIIDAKRFDWFRQRGNFESAIANFDSNGNTLSATARFAGGFSRIEWDVDMFMEELVCTFNNKYDAAVLSDNLWKKKIWNTVVNAAFA